MMEDIMIEVQHLSKCYRLYDQPIDRMKEALHPFRKRYHREFYALQDVSFSVQKGETVGIIGKNGSGKSTLLKMITGVLTPTGGNIDIQGRISALLELGAGFNPEFTGIENIYMNGTIMGYTKAEMDVKLESIVSFADIGDFIHQPVKMYSSGMFARLAFAVSINVEPDILIVDEALSVGDVFFQNKCFRKFEELREQGVTILFVSHDMGSVKQLTQRVLWLENGKQKMFGDTDTVCEAYFKEQIEAQNVLVEEAAAHIQGEDTEILVGDGKVAFPALPEVDDKILHEDVVLRSFFLQNMEGNRVEQLVVGSAYTAVCVAEIRRPMKNLIFGFSLENNKGLNLISVNSFINNEERLIQVEQACILRVEFSFSLPRILQGEYLLSPAIAQGTQKTNTVLTWLTNILRITIQNEGYNLSLLEIPAEVEARQYQKDQVRFL